ncbi:hypothetical protein BDZ45DRAFT_641278 [Acephala macrosclerotiorum]|nr:hypothetical protein BDZ45DRAFT_641278 [Acephala macrosclerotiorum]
MSLLSREEARILIGKIREDNGGISPEDRAACPPAVLRALESVRRKLGSATKTLATNLYSKDTRFVYELIQNAEDNEYTRAEAEGEKIYLRFNMYPDRIVLESNEDGFCEEHVKAICSTGQSTKTVTQGYIGEKGIGFKSVFKVAKKAHIQSGPFSFSFAYTRDSDDDGLGMVTPLDEDYDDLPEDVNTRITLTLLDSSNFEQRAKDLLDIPDTLLLFLTKLNTLYINIYPPQGNATRIEYSTTADRERGTETVMKSLVVDGEYTEKIQDFYVVRRQIHNLPPDAARRHTNQATVLAFPIDEDEEPVIAQQYVFAFLPVRPAGFSFLIQSDFVTQASREDVFHSARNLSLLSGVAETFRDAVLRFCDHPSLQYQWMRYLPSASITDEFWRELRPQIIALLRTTPCLRPWSESSLELPTQLYRVTEDLKDEHGQPLFSDLAPEAYLSDKYQYSGFKALDSLGTKTIDFTLIIARVRADLGRADSKLRDTLKITATDDWHTRAAQLLAKPFAKPNEFSSTIQSLKSLELIPLQDFRWTSATSWDLPVFLPYTGNAEIPRDLNLKLVQPTAVLNIARTTLFLHLGVTVAPATNIISLISGRYRGQPSCTLSQNISHLRYLYWNLPRDTTTLDKNIYLIDQDSNNVSRTTDHPDYVYFEEPGEEYGPQRLFLSTYSNGCNIPGLAIHILHWAYLSTFQSRIPAETIHHGRSWKQWLAEFANVKSYPQIRNSGSRMLSDEFKYIIAHQPSKLVGLLKRYWSLYESEITNDVSKELKIAGVPLEDGRNKILKTTFFPLPKLKGIVYRLGIKLFPFLRLPEELTDDDENAWHFLTRFGVKFSEDFHFYVEALICLSNENEGEIGGTTLDAVYEVYGAVQRHCFSSDDVAYLCEKFYQDDLVYVPSGISEGLNWTCPEECVWAGPVWLRTKTRLAGIPKYAEHEHLFRVILKVRDAAWEDFLEELKALKREDQPDKDTIADIYRRLWREFEHDSSYETIRTSFEESELVFLPSRNTWHPLSSCIWADDRIQIPQKSSIKTPYTTLEDFFCRVLGITKPNLAMHVQALKELSRTQPAASASEIKHMIMLISSMEPSAEDVEDLKRSNIFCVKTANGLQNFTNTTADFAIVDRAEYGAAFTGRINMLDYSIREVHACRSLLLALGLNRRHLSEMVEESTTGRDGAIDQRLSQAFQSKAYALFRCTIHYRSSRSRDGDVSLYHQLLGATVYASDGITKSISVVQYGKTITVDNSRANFHLEEVDGELRLYVPRNESSREECFFWQLPRRLMKHFAISDPSAEAVLGGVIGCRSLVAVDAILRNAGIVEVDGIERPLEPDDDTHSFEFEDVARALETVTPTRTESRASQNGRSTPASTPRTTRASHNEAGSSIALLRESPNFDSQSSPRSGLSNLAPNGTLSEVVRQETSILDTGYASLLERVINSAARMSIPSEGSQSVDVVSTQLEASVFAAIFATRPMERDRKVGAAGELLAFEILLNLQLDNFTRANWKSTIRKEVSVHRKYRDLDPWTGRETADITYADTNGWLTQRFIAQGYLDGAIWGGERPTYYLEVKTTRDCSEQFYMSGSQYQRMQSMKLSPQAASPNIYVLFRVFSLEGRIGLQVYVDPESARLAGQLEFNVDTWAVRAV